MKRFLLLISIFIFFVTQKSIAQVDFALNGATSVNTPANGCELSSTETIKIVIVNVGSITGTNVNFDINYSLNGGATVTESGTINAGFASNATYTFTYSQPADFSACQIHTLDFELVINGLTDTDPSNNTVTRNVTSDCAPTFGTTTAPSSVCQGSNSGNLNISGYNGVVQDWQWSTNSGTSWTSSGNSSDDENFTNIASDTWYWTIVGSPYGICPADTTPYVEILVDAPSVGGTLGLDQNVCSNGNYGFLSLGGQTGTVNDWQFSTDGGLTWTNIGYTDDTLWFTDVFTTTQYQVEVQNGSCSSVYSSTAELTVIAGSDAGSIVGEDTVCNAMADSLLSVNAYYGNIQEWIYSSDSATTWVSTGQSSSSYSYAALLGYTVFGVVVKEANCPNDTTFHPIIVLPINVSGGPNVTITEGDSVQLAGSGGQDYFWTPSNFISDVNVADPFVWPENDMTYSVQVTDQYGCQDTAFVLITVEPDLSKVIVPNLITPNGDGFNDLWKIQYIEAYDEAKIYVFDAYGQQLYYSSPYNNDWDATFQGKTLPDGTYFYLIELTPDLDPIKGTLTIISNK
ncbi:MAG: gliding motility-associated C-terminal domain-containing protein [Putridiphycobacter sp.]